MKTGGLSLDQAPQLSVPMSFFLTVPAGILLAGCILITTGMAALISPWMPQTLALTHAGTLGVLAMGMIGALYQMTPVVAGTAVPLTRIAHIVHVFLLAGLAGLAWRLLGGPASAMSAAIVCFTIALLAFLLPLAWALLGSATKNDTVRGMQLAVLSLVVITVTGLSMAQGFAGGIFSENRMLWVQFHLTVALLGWVGGLIMAVSWQVVPMFYLASNVSKTTMRWFFWLLLSGLILPLVVALSAAKINSSVSHGQLLAIGALPAALVIWLLHPALILRKISRRKRKRSDASLLFWKAGLGTALLMIPVTTAVLLLPDPRWQVLFGWLAIWGWAAMIMHGMLSRIVPFLVWYHRFSPRLGFEPVPSMRSLLSQQRIKTGFVLHLASVALGVIAIFTQVQLLAQLTGLLLVAVAISLASMLIHVLLHR
ncbi:hypothetical protein ACFL3I_03010 [Pseudomonadota bacterium]